MSNANRYPGIREGEPQLRYVLTYMSGNTQKRVLQRYGSISKRTDTHVNIGFDLIDPPGLELIRNISLYQQGATVLI